MTMSTQFHSLKVTDLQRETEGCVSVAFEVPNTLQAQFTFASGQYLTFKTTIDGEEIRRSYSLCSAPHENEWRVAIKQIPNGKFSTYANQTLQTGATLEVMAPMGNFKFEPNPSAQNHYVLFAAGSGVTPIFSILKTILQAEPQSGVTLFYGNKGFAEVIFREELEALKNRFLDRLNLVHVFSRENIGVPLLKGRIDAARTKDLLSAFLKNQTINGAYICGPQDMILAVKDELSAFGVKVQAGGSSSSSQAENVAGSIGTDVQMDGIAVINGDVFSPNLPIDRLLDQVALLRSLANQPLAHLLMVPNPSQHPNGDFYLKDSLVANDPLDGAEKLTFSGIGLYHRDLFKDLALDEPTKLAPLLREAMAKNRVSGEKYTGPWHDVGTPQRLQELNAANE